ncbi:MAG: hypothetical protein C0404_04340 [Verrucomicrobia bacterium]|nr:hypothetical protein [Verrucomicrobiota bacterium]
MGFSVRSMLVVVAAFVMAPSLTADTTVNSTNRWAWSSGASWLDCRVDTTNGMVVGQYYCGGYMYGGSAGWIRMGSGQPTNGYRFTNLSTNDYGVNHDGKGHLTGFAWSASYGWISFEWTNNPDASTAPKVNLQNGVLSGNAWGGSLGWISLSNISAYVKTDFMTNGPAAANGMPVAWQMSTVGATNILKGGTNDWDSDGASDYREYVSGTNPTNASEYLLVDSCTISSGTNFVLTWPSEDTRLYKVETNGALTNATGWADSGFGVISPSSSGVTTLTLSCGSVSQLYYRVKVFLPLGR